MNAAAAPRQGIAELISLRAAGRWGQRWKHSSSKRPRRGSQEAKEHKNKVARSEEESSSQQDDVSANTTTFGRVNGNASLPLPPFLRSRYRGSLSSSEQQLDPRKAKIEGTYMEGNKHKLQVKLKRAPLATRMQENPYARMLAESVREERYAGQRLPRSSLLRFTLVEDEETAQEKSPDQAQEAGNETQLTLLPLSLFGEALPKNKNASKFTSEENRAAEALNDATSGVEGASSYVLARHDMLSWISSRSQERGDRILGVGTRLSLDGSGRLRRTRSKTSSFVWQKDMPEMVLGSMRKVVHRLLRHLLQEKTIADRQGPIMQVPSLEGQTDSLAMLDRVDNAMCLLSMRRSQTTDNSLAARHRLESQVEMEEPMWMRDEEKRLMWGQGSQLAPEDDVDARYPTVRYRNRRVPVYSLHRLLGGEEAVEKLVKGTCFANSEWVALTSNLWTQNLLQWLFRLHSFLAYEPESD